MSTWDYTVGKGLPFEALTVKRLPYSGAPMPQAIAQLRGSNRQFLICGANRQLPIMTQMIDLPLTV